jgi:molecular chaperone GrpE
MNSNKDEVLDENAEKNHHQVENSEETNAENTAETELENSNNGTKAGKSDKTAELEAKLAEANDKYLRLYSEFDNFRKRTVKEKGEIIKTAGEDVFKTILPLIDDFERAIRANEGATDVNAVSEGFQLIYHKFKNSLKQKGLEEMESIGKTFDADVMEAITSIPAPSEDLKGKVVDEVEKGYSLHGKVIRYAKVVTGS